MVDLSLIGGNQHLDHLLLTYLVVLLPYVDQVLVLRLVHLELKDLLDLLGFITLVGLVPGLEQEVGSG